MDTPSSVQASAMLPHLGQLFGKEIVMVDSSGLPDFTGLIIFILLPSFI
jgi:hypothetical protein